MESCCICLSPIREGPSHRLTLPGCDHAFHASCMLTNAQYDVRCPVCRRVPEGVVVARRPKASTVHSRPSAGGAFESTVTLVLYPATSHRPPPRRNPFRLPRQRRRRRVSV